MAWPGLKTWTAGAVLTASDLLTYLNNALAETAPAKAVAAGDIFYATAANAISRLAKGAAYQYLGQNAGLTAPQWFSPPSARAYHSTNQSINNTVGTALALNSERFDTDTIHDTVTNNSRLTCKTAGKYLIFGHVEWAANVTNNRQVSILVNGATNIAISAQPANVNALTTRQSISSIYSLAVNDYVELFVYQDSGGALNVLASGNYSPEFGMVWVAP